MDGDDWITLEQVILSGQVPEESLQRILVEKPDFAEWLRSRSEQRISGRDGREVLH